MSVVEFKRPEQIEPHGQGPARCIACKHEWQAVAPARAVELECPECRTMKGRFTHIFSTYEDEPVWTCNCGNDLFRVTASGHLCVNCGVFQRF